MRTTARAAVTIIASGAVLDAGTGRAGTGVGCGAAGAPQIGQNAAPGVSLEPHLKQKKLSTALPLPHAGLDAQERVTSLHPALGSKSHISARKCARRLRSGWFPAELDRRRLYSGRVTAVPFGNVTVPFPPT